MLATSAPLSSRSGAANPAAEAHTIPSGPQSPQPGRPFDGARPFNGAYRGAYLNQIAFPLGGMGAGMLCLEGCGALSKFSLHHRPNLASQPIIFGAICIKQPDSLVRVLEGPIPGWKLEPHIFEDDMPRAPACVTWGLPRFRNATFEARFPFGSVRLNDDDMPVEVEVTAWSPFSPLDADNSSLPVASLEYTFVNRGSVPIEAVFSFNAENFMADPQIRSAPDPKSLDRIQSTSGGFILYGPGAPNHLSDEGSCAVWVDDPGAKVNHAWYGDGLGLFFDSVQMVWRDISSGKCYAREPLPNRASLGASIFVPFTLAAGKTRTARLCLAWHVPRSNSFWPNFALRDGKAEPLGESTEFYQPWYTGRFANIEEVKRYWQISYSSLRKDAQRFKDAFYDSTLPPEVIEAVAANLTVLKSPTVLRQVDGKIWAWEGTGDEAGAGGPGSCTHVWNYAQALPHLFPALERSLRETEFGPDLGEDGFQMHRAALPIRPIADTDLGRFLPAAADGQLGGIIKTYRDWRISGDTAWMRALWPKIRLSLDYCIRTWDPKFRGWIEEPHLNTYDVQFYGADSLCTGLYIGALKAATLMGEALGDIVDKYAELLNKGIRRMEVDLFNGEYFIQKVEWRDLQTPFPSPNASISWMMPVSPEAQALVQAEGPSYQYGGGCLSDGVFGPWLSHFAGLGHVLNAGKVEDHLKAVYRYNFKKDLADYARVGQSFYATGDEAGLLVCTWPKGRRPTLPFIHADKIWTGVEYQVAAHLIVFGLVEEGLNVVRAARRRYDGRVRNPFAEVEAGQWYARAMSSYVLLDAFSGARFDAVDKILYLKPSIKGDFRCFLSTATGYGTVGVKNGQPFVDVVSGAIPYSKIEFTAAPEQRIAEPP